MQPSLGLGERREGRQRPLLHPLRKAGLGDEALDVGGGANDRRVRRLDVHLGRGDAASEHRLLVDRPPAHRQTLELAANLVEVGPGVDQRAECHVPGDAGEAVEPGQPGHLRVRRTAQAAP